MSNPLDEHTKQEIQETIKALLATFTVQYAKHYTLGLVKKVEDEAKQEPEHWELETRPENTDDIKSGMLTKEGAIRKSWKKRWFVVHHDYTVSYFASEADAKKGKKPKGTISLCGYDVVEDVGESLLKQAKKLAEQMGMDVNELPKPKQYPDHTLELHHWKRRSYYIQCADAEQKKEWVDVFKNACRRAYGLTNKEPVHENAFHASVRETRWELGRWGWWSYGGSEVQILSDLISDQLDYAVMYKVYSKITGPWMVRNSARNNVMKVVDGLVSGAVNPAWQAMAKAVEELKPKIEPVIKEQFDPLGKAKLDILEKIKEGVLSTINPILEEHVTPHLGKVLEILKSPVHESFDKSYELFDKQIEKFKEGVTNLADTTEGFRDLDYFHRGWDMYHSTDAINIMYEPLWALNTIFKDIHPWSLIYDTKDSVRTTMDNAMYTFEREIHAAVEADEKLKSDAEAAKAAVDAAKAKVLEKYKRDGAELTWKVYAQIMKAIVMPPFNELVIPACKAILEPLAELVPEAMKQLIDIMQMFNDLLNGIIDGAIATVVKA